MLLSGRCPVSPISFLLPPTSGVNSGRRLLSSINQNSKWWPKETRWPCLKITGRPPMHISLCDNFLFISNFPCLSRFIYYSLFFICIFTFWILKGNTELEVIHSPHKLNCFPAPLHISTAADLYPPETDAVLPSGGHIL